MTVMQPAVYVIATVLVYNPPGRCNGLREIHPL